MIRILVVDDDQGLRTSLKASLLSINHFQVEEAFDGVNAIEKIKNAPHRFDLVFLDVDMPRMNGLELLRKIKEEDPGVIAIILTAHANLKDAVVAVKEGAFDYLSKPVSNEELIHITEKAINAHSLISHVAASSPVLVEAGRKIIGNTSQMHKVFNIINKLAKVDTPVLIRGASGTGKELVAKAIHYNSSRKDQKFVAINCSAIPENLFESELFGHEKGSFTGADQRKIGKFQFAEGGTLFLDEVGDMPALMQVKILRVLQEKMFTPVGSNREISTNVRIIAATNRPLEEMIQKGTFREDLFYRLNVVPIFLPPLAERKNDLEHLIKVFIRKFNTTHSKKIVGIAADAMTVLKKYDWPGNIRELENVIEHTFVLETSNVINLVSLPEGVLEKTGTSLISAAGKAASGDDPKELPFLVSSEDFNDFENQSDEDDVVLASDEDIDDTSPLLVETGSNQDLDFNLQKEAFEKDFIIRALKTFKGKVNQTALHANIPKKTLLRKIEKYGINPKDFVSL